MTTYPLAAKDGDRDRAAAVRRARELGRTLDPGRVLALALLMVIAYAAFAGGAIQDVALPRSAAEPRLQVAVALVAALGLGVWLWGGSLQLSAPRLGVIGAALLAAFTVWSGITLAWSVSPDGTWLEVNRYITYTVILVLAIIVGSSARRPTEFAHAGFLTVAGVVTVYALGQKLVPALHIPGLINLDQTGSVPRLQQPFGYWNALALFVSMAVPMLLAVCIDRTRPVRHRLAALVALQLVFLTIAFTYSRGGLVALGLGIAAALAIGGGRLRGLLWLGLGAAGSAPPVAFGLISHSLAAADVPLSHRSVGGAELAVVLIISALVMLGTARSVMRLERRVTVSPLRARGIARGLIALLLVGLFVAVVAVALSHRGLAGTVSHVWHNFTTSHGVNDTNPNNFVSADSGNRWVWWKEAVGAFSDRPLGGWGAGSFPVVHLLYRRNDLNVLQPHSVPLQFLAETGVVGAVLAIGALVALSITATRWIRREPAGRQRIIAAALLGAVVAYGIHACYDWDSDIPGVTLPMLMFAGVLVGAAGRAGRSSSRSSPRSSKANLPARGFAAPGLAMRLLSVVVSCAAMCSYAVSVVLPSLAAGKASDSVLAAALGTPGALQGADQQARLAAQLDPLSDAGLLAEATVALRRDERTTARMFDIRALARNPSDTMAWEDLSYIEVLAGRLRPGIDAAEHVLQLDPEGPTSVAYAVGVAQKATADQALPQDSPTATRTPVTGTAP